MACQNNFTTTFEVVPGAEIFANLPHKGVLRFERQGAAMSGRAEMASEGGALALHFSDGASVYLKNV